MTRAIHDLRNLGPKLEGLLAEIDIRNEDDLRAIGVVEAWCRLKLCFGPQVTLTALYAMEGAMQQCDWRALDKDTKERLCRQSGNALRDRMSAHRSAR